MSRAATQSASMATLEKELQTVNNTFLRIGLQYVIDGASTQDITNVLNFRISKLLAREQSEANMFRAMASFAPAFGMVGTLLGLVNMLGDLDQELAVLGANMAVAMMTTLYGIIAANVLFKPIAIKLEHRTQQRVETMNMVLEGVILMSQRRSAGSIRETMKTYMVDHEDEIGGKRTRKRAPTGKAVQ